MLQKIQSLNLVTVSGGKAVTTSLKIAATFGKQHKHVLEAIESLQVPNEWREPNFRLSSTEQKMPNGGTKEIPMYTITRDGFTILAMGFTGRKAMEFKLAYIEAYNAMERRLSMPTAADVVQNYINQFGTEWILERLQKCELLEAYEPMIPHNGYDVNGFCHATVRRGSNPVRGGRKISNLILAASHPDMFALIALNGKIYPLIAASQQ